MRKKISMAISGVITATLLVSSANIPFVSYDSAAFAEAPEASASLSTSTGIVQMENELASLKANKSNIDSNISSKKKELSDIENKISSLEAKKEAVTNETVSLEDSIRQLKEELSVLYDEKEQLESKYAGAKSAYDEAKTMAENEKESLTDAENSAKRTYDAAVEKYDKVKETGKNAIEKKAEGARGFFNSVNATNALKSLLKGETEYSQYVKMGTDGDATSLESIEKTFQFMKECNSIRKSLGLRELRVTDNLMANEMVQVDYSAANLGHSSIFPSVVENLTYNFSYAAYTDKNDKANPFKRWYDMEKYNEENDNGGQTGHYYTIIDPDLKTTGFAINENGTAEYSGYIMSNCCGQSFGYYDSDDDSNIVSYTVDDYEKRFKEYADPILSTVKEYEDTESTLEEAKNEYDNAKSANDKYNVDEKTATYLGTISDLSSQITDKSNKCTSTENSLEEETKKLNDANASMTNLSAEITEANDEKEKLEKEIPDLESQSSSLEKEINDITVRINDAKTKEKEEQDKKANEEKKNNDDKNAAADVSEKISSTPETISNDSEYSNCKETITKYDSLTADQLKYIGQNETNKVNRMRQNVSAFEARVSDVSSAIITTSLDILDDNALSNAVTVISSYDSLTELQKNMVANDVLDKITKIRDAISNYENNKNNKNNKNENNGNENGKKETNYIKVNSKKVTKNTISKAMIGKNNNKITKIIIGSKVKTLSSKFLTRTNIKTVVLETKKLSKKTVKNSMKSSKVNKIQVKVSAKKADNKKYSKKYSKFFTKKNCGKTVKIKYAK